MIDEQAIQSQKHRAALVAMVDIRLRILCIRYGGRTVLEGNKKPRPASSPSISTDDGDMKRSAGSKWRRMWAYSKDHRRAKRSDSKWERQRGKRAIEEEVRSDPRR